MYRGWPPSQGWRTFLTNHVDGIAATDLFVLPTITFRLLYCLVILRHGRRLWVSFGVTTNPTAEFAPDHRGVSLGQCTSLSYSGQGHCVWSDLQAAFARYGHSGQADCSPIAVAEPVRRETDRHDPTGLSRPPDRVRGGPSAPVAPDRTASNHSRRSVFDREMNTITCCGFQSRRQPDIQPRKNLLNRVCQSVIIQRTEIVLAGEM
jgi:hypothetical protein